MIARLAACYRQGRLAPFLGAGMSVPTCPGWAGFVDGLEEKVFGLPLAADRGTDPESLIRRANAAVRQTRLFGQPTLYDAVQSSLGLTGREDVPAQTVALAKLFWPLVLTSNYDDLFFRAWNSEHKASGSSMQVLGRGAADCRDVLTSLHSSRAPILWALQGYIGESLGSRVRQLRRQSAIKFKRGPVQGTNPLSNAGAAHAKQSGDTRRQQLREQLVVGHEEYRRVSYTEPQFRRAFAEVFRARSLLFVGSSLADQYLLNLFGETLEIFGANPYSHYALVLKGTTDPEFLRSRLNTFVYEYDSHGELPDILRDLKTAVDSSAPFARNWTYSLPRSTGSAPGEAADLHIVRGQMGKPAARECLALGVSVDTEGAVEVSGAERRVLDLFGCAQALSKCKWPKGSLVLRVDGAPLFLFCFATQGGDQDVRQYSRAITAVLSAVDLNEFDLVRTRLPLPDSDEKKSWWRALLGGLMQYFQRDFLQRYWLMESIRAFGTWRRRPGDAGGPRLAVHLSDPGILFDMSTGRIDPIELLLCDDLNFTVEVTDEDDALVLRESFQCEGVTSLRNLAGQLRLVRTLNAGAAPEQWLVEVDPSPTGLPQVQRLSEPGVLDTTLSELGVLTDSVLRFVRITLPPPAAPAAQTAPAAAAKTSSAASSADKPSDQGKD